MLPAPSAKLSIEFLKELVSYSEIMIIFSGILEYLQRSGRLSCGIEIRVAFIAHMKLLITTIIYGAVSKYQLLCLA